MGSIKRKTLSYTHKDYGKIIWNLAYHKMSWKELIDKYKITDDNRGFIITHVMQAQADFPEHFKGKDIVI